MKDILSKIQTVVIYKIVMARRLARQNGLSAIFSHLLTMVFSWFFAFFVGVGELTVSLFVLSWKIIHLIFVDIGFRIILLFFQAVLLLGKGIKNFFSFIFKRLQDIFSFFTRIHLPQRTSSSTVIFAEKKHSKKKKRKTPRFGFQIKLRYFIFGCFTAFIIFVPMMFYLWVNQLPNPHSLANLEPSQTTKIYDRNGHLLYQLYANQNRTVIPLSQIPPDVIHATIAIEDHKFYTHPGFDVEALARAVRETFFEKNVQGGSTITQQLIKSTLLSPEQSYERKAKELVLAFWAERIYSKDQILEMYFNQVPYGGTAWGIEAASQVYFGKSVQDLDLAEASLLAGLPAAPTAYSPFGDHPEYAKKRQEEVLTNMVSEGYISPEEKTTAENEELHFAQPTVSIEAPHFVMYVKNLLVEKYGLKMVEQGGLKVTTTLDLDVQKNAQQIVSEEVQKLAPLSVSNGAALVTDPKTGQILAMVGSRDYFDTDHQGNVNVTTALRQPGSSIKPITYAAALEKGMTAASVIDDTPVSYAIPGAPTYTPVNYDGKFHGKVTLRTSLGNSLNIPAVKTLAQIGVPAMIDMGKRMGITTWTDSSQYGLSLTLGGGAVKMTDLATAYGVLAHDGVRNPVTPFLTVTNAKGEVLEDNTSPQGYRVLSNGIAFILSDILADNNARLMEFGPNSSLVIPNKRVSVKTGTTDQKRDNWTVGYTKDYLVATWVGNNDNSPMNQQLASGITGAAPIWNRIMSGLIKDKPNEQVSPPASVAATAVCSYNGLLTCNGCPTKTEYFIKGTEPKTSCIPNMISPFPSQQAAIAQ